MMIRQNPLGHVTFDGLQDSLFAQYQEIDSLADFLLGRVWTDWQPFAW